MDERRSEGHGEGERTIWRRLRGSRGAGFAEYSLVFALLVVSSVGGISYIESKSKKEARNQIDCVASRPPPDSCRPDPVTKPTLASDPATPPTTIGDNPFTPSDDPAEIPPTPPPPPTTPSTATVPATVPNPQGGPDLPNPYGAVNPSDPTLWGFSVTVNLLRPNPSGPGSVPANGSFVIFEYWGDGASGETQHLTGSCVADDAGNCTFSDFNYGYSDVTALHVVIRNISASPGVAGPPTPSAWDIPRP